MAYSDQRTRTSQRGIAVTLVTALDDAGTLATGSYTNSIRWVIPK